MSRTYTIINGGTTAGSGWTGCGNNTATKDGVTLYKYLTIATSSGCSYSNISYDGSCRSCSYVCKQEETTYAVTFYAYCRYYGTYDGNPKYVNCYCYVTHQPYL